MPNISVSINVLFYASNACHATSIHCIASITSSNLNDLKKTMKFSTSGSMEQLIALVHYTRHNQNFQPFGARILHLNFSTSCI